MPFSLRISHTTISIRTDQWRNWIDYAFSCVRADNLCTARSHHRQQCLIFLADKWVFIKTEHLPLRIHRTTNNHCSMYVGCVVPHSNVINHRMWHCVPALWDAVQQEHYFVGLNPYDSQDTTVRWSNWRKRSFAVKVERHRVCSWSSVTSWTSIQEMKTMGLTKDNGLGRRSDSMERPSMNSSYYQLLTRSKRNRKCCSQSESWYRRILIAGDGEQWNVVGISCGHGECAHLWHVRVSLTLAPFGPSILKPNLRRQKQTVDEKWTRSGFASGVQYLDSCFGEITSQS